MIFVLKTNPALYTWRIKKLLHEIWLIFFRLFFIWSPSRHRKTSKPSRESYCIKKCPYGNIVVFYVLFDKCWPYFESVRFLKAIFHRRKWLKTNKKKKLWNSTSNKGQNKTVHQIGLINLSWSQRNYAVLVPFLNSVAV